MNVFTYDNEKNKVEINESEILLVREFKKIFDRDKAKGKPLAFREFTYIYLAIDWKSPYAQYTEQERHEEALNDSELSEKEFNDPDFRAACRKYRALQESNKSIKMLRAALTAADQFIDYFETIVDLNERDLNGKPVFSAEKVMKEVSMLNKVHEELVELENAVKREISEKATLRAGAVEDFDPGEF